MAKTVIGLMDDFLAAKSAVGDLVAAGFPAHEIGVLAKDRHESEMLGNVRRGATLVSVTVPSDEAAAWVERLLRKHRPIAIQEREHDDRPAHVSAANQAALNERVYYAEERAAARSSDGRYDGRERRLATTPHTGPERRRII